MDNLKIKNLGPIKEANINFGDLTILVGPQASGKSIFVQMLKLIVDKNHIRKILEQNNFVWGKNLDDILDLYFGEGMNGIWYRNTEMEFDNEKIAKTDIIRKSKELEEAKELIFYIPAQRVISIADGFPKNFNGFVEDVPYVLRQFSETLRQFLQNDGLSKPEVIFPRKQNLKAPLTKLFNESIFHDATVIIETESSKKKIKLEIDFSTLPFMTWSAGQKEFMPLLLSFYWLCPPTKTSQREGIKCIVIEEPEMGLHPQAIKSVLVQVMDLMDRGYKVIISTHSPVMLEFAWAVKYLKENNANFKSLAEVFDIKPIHPLIKDIFTNILENKQINTYYFDRKDDHVIVKDISSLDAGNDDLDIAEWGGLSTFISKATDIISNLAAKHE